MILGVVFAVQTSMNFNASVYGNAVKPLQAAFPDINQSGARVGQMIFLVAYAFGCELRAPWSGACVPSARRGLREPGR